MEIAAEAPPRSAPGSGCPACPPSVGRASASESNRRPRPTRFFCAGILRTQPDVGPADPFDHRRLDDRMVAFFVDRHLDRSSVFYHRRDSSLLISCLQKDCAGTKRTTAEPSTPRRAQAKMACHHDRVGIAAVLPCSGGTNICGFETDHEHCAWNGTSRRLPTTEVRIFELSMVGMVSRFGHPWTLTWHSGR